MQTESCMEHSSGIQLVLLAGFLTDLYFPLSPFSEKFFFKGLLSQQLLTACVRSVYQHAYVLWLYKL